VRAVDAVAPSMARARRSPLSVELAFVVVPEWQASGSARALRLVDGAMAIAGDLPVARTTVLEVPVEAGDALGTGVERLSAIQDVAARHAAALDAAAGVPVSIGGDCGIAVTAAARSMREADTALVWLDAHPDLHTPASSRSHAFAGMVLRTLLGDGPDGLAPVPAVAAERVVLAGVRSIDDDEEACIGDRDLALVPCPDDPADAEGFATRLVAAVLGTGARRVHVHVDVDVLDPAEFSSKSEPVPFGLSVAALTGAIRALVARFPLAGASIAEFAPSDPAEAAGDLGTILRVVAALRSGGGTPTDRSASAATRGDGADA